MSELTDFLLARIAEDEADVKADLVGREYPNPARVLAECEAKRRIVEACSDFEAIKTPLYALAAVYADHEDFREEWKP